MTKIEVFDPAMCCSTGVCGPSVDPALARFASDLEWLREQGFSVERFNLSQEPKAFVTNPTVKQALAEGGQRRLPLILINGQIVSEGFYPGRAVLLEAITATTGTRDPAGPTFRIVDRPAPGVRRCC